MPLSLRSVLDYVYVMRGIFLFIFQCHLVATSLQAACDLPLFHIVGDRDRVYWYLALRLDGVIRCSEKCWFSPEPLAVVAHLALQVDPEALVSLLARVPGAARFESTLLVSMAARASFCLEWLQLAVSARNI